MRGSVFEIVKKINNMPDYLTVSVEQDGNQVLVGQ